MSVMEIPDALYRINRDMEIARLIDQGLDLMAARAMADEIMRHTFIARTTAIQCEFEADYADYIEDMSLGGQIYKEPR